ncbi:MarC family protein [Pseudoalteromonas prydzensis]|uniref:MarC family protein n=1 Tax=Pseudoalteromonas prydzensis TaxID=182141 RepID=UPI0007E508C4|nr:MarC family protein [Pseudoalteromonas prydzensis]MBE0378166.1 multiple antibiotic resistance protein [Pseudoalteromonas prydzensis ACAM 620]
MLEKLSQDALVIWATIDPIGTMALFAALTSHLTEQQRRKTAFKTVLYAAGVLLGSILVGQLILNAMGIRLVSFQLGGGIILFLFGLQMIFGNDSNKAQQDPAHDIAVFPLAIPATATPGAILAVILLTDNHIYPITTQIGTALVMLAVLGLTLILLLLSGKIIKLIGTGGASILTRVMGMILAAFSVELIMTALEIKQWVNLD